MWQSSRRSGCQEVLAKGHGKWVVCYTDRSRIFWRRPMTRDIGLFVFLTKKKKKEKCNAFFFSYAILSCEVATSCWQDRVEGCKKIRSWTDLGIHRLIYRYFCSIFNSVVSLHECSLNAMEGFGQGVDFSRSRRNRAALVPGMLGRHLPGRSSVLGGGFTVMLLVFAATELWVVN